MATGSTIFTSGSLSMTVSRDTLTFTRSTGTSQPGFMGPYILATGDKVAYISQ